MSGFADHEIESYHYHQKGKHRADKLPDKELAISTFLDELKTSIDHLLGVGVALGLNAETLTTLTQQREMGKHQPSAVMTQLLGTGNSSESNSIFQSQTRGNGARFDEMDRDVTHIQQEETVIGIKLQSKPQCCVCFDTVWACRSRRLRCAHLWCLGCLKNSFERARMDENLFPPKCCGAPIPVFNIEAVMSKHEMESFKNAEVEFSTTDRIYCSKEDCRKFINPKNIKADRATCPYCLAHTCRMCKGPYLADNKCPGDLALQATLALATQRGWQRCFSCRAVVELTQGCFHIHCSCGAQFCYLCGSKWKSCRCNSTDEVRWHQRRGQFQREHRRHDPDRNNEDRRCVHLPSNFVREERTGPSFMCDMCDDRDRETIMRCRQCPFRICPRCWLRRLVQQ
ncbi:hypothetical protein BJY04DRAFT_44369 [Aspergillus karnatakaensis]|uniref:RBR family RING finger protein n=1 Tax=Aspergillus karnatakaensis TaxID=1810916 RepID=UPI003CCDFF41